MAFLHQNRLVPQLTKELSNPKLKNVSIFLLTFIFHSSVFLYVAANPRTTSCGVVIIILGVINLPMGIVIATGISLNILRDCAFLWCHTGDNRVGVVS